MKLNRFFGFFCVLALLSPLAARSFAAPDPNRIIVMISLDGVAAYYIDDPKADIPTLREIATEGARAQSMKVSTPSVTWPNHTTLVTGDNPARHGVVGNAYFDRTTQKQMQLIQDPIFDKDQIVKVPTIYDLAHEAGLKTSAFKWPATRNAHALDWTVPDVAKDDLLHKYTTPTLQAELKSAGVWQDGEKLDARGEVRVVSDETCVKEARLVLHQHHPNFLLLHLAWVDHTEHANGPKTPAAYAAVHQADAQVREIWDELKQDYGSNYDLVVTSDHGFSPIEHAVLPNVLLRDAGLVQVKGLRITGGSVRMVPQGGAAFLYILDPVHRDAIVSKIKQVLAGAKGIEKIVGPDQLHEYGVADPKDDPNAPDMILFAQEGSIFGDTAAGMLPYAAKPERKGSHGHDANLPDLHGIFLACGQGITPGAKLDEIQNTDVAPTLAKLLDIPLPNVDGKPLTAILRQPQ